MSVFFISKHLFIRPKANLKKNSFISTECNELKFQNKFITHFSVPQAHLFHSAVKRVSYIYSSDD